MNSCSGNFFLSRAYLLLRFFSLIERTKWWNFFFYSFIVIESMRCDISRGKTNFDRCEEINFFICLYGFANNPKDAQILLKIGLLGNYKRKKNADTFLARNLLLELFNLV